MAIEQTGMAGVIHMLHGRGCAQYAEYGIVKGFGFLNVIGADHNVIQHEDYSSLWLRPASRLDA